MSVNKELLKRAEGKCELCSADNNLEEFVIPNSPDVSSSLCVCNTCSAELVKDEDFDVNHWRCLNESMWSTVPGIQVVAWRMLHKLKSHGWPQDLLDMLYLDEETLAWAEQSGDHIDDEDKVIHKDSNGATLQSGDSVVLIKDLNVKGAGFTAKRGTHVRNISLVFDNASQIEGRVSGQQIVILTQYVKKS